MEGTEGTVTMRGLEHSGFTRVELLAALLIITILFFIAGAVFKARHISRGGLACSAELEQLAGALERCAYMRSENDWGSITRSHVREYLDTDFICPTGGKQYWTEQAIHCSKYDPMYPERHHMSR